MLFVPLMMLLLLVVVVAFADCWLFPDFVLLCGKQREWHALEVTHLIFFISHSVGNILEVGPFISHGVQRSAGSISHVPCLQQFGVPPTRFFATFLPVLVRTGDTLWPQYCVVFVLVVVGGGNENCIQLSIQSNLT